MRQSLKAVTFVIFKITRPQHEVLHTGKPRGCLVVLGAINCMPANKSVEDFMGEQRAIREKFMRQRFRRGIAEGDLPRATDINALASFYTSVVDGMAIRSRDGELRAKRLMPSLTAQWRHGTSWPRRTQRTRRHDCHRTISGSRRWRSYPSRQ
jgi:hypothetical protein